MNKIEEVEVYVIISGDYCSWHECSINIVYDITNNKQLSYYSKEEIDELWKQEDGLNYSDITIKPALLINGKYYINF